MRFSVIRPTYAALTCEFISMSEIACLKFFNWVPQSSAAKVHRDLAGIVKGHSTSAILNRKDGV